jgi:hypothetical protein
MSLSKLAAAVVGGVIIFNGWAPCPGSSDVLWQTGDHRGDLRRGALDGYKG